MPYTEDQFEKAVLELLRDTLGYETLYGPNMLRDYSNPLLADEFTRSLEKLNPHASLEALKQAELKVLRPEKPNLIENNCAFNDMLTGGVEVSYFDCELKYDRIKLIDFDHPERNSFIAVNQFTVMDEQTKRPDIVIFINGLPLVVIELKSISREEADTSTAYRQIRNYTHAIPCLFTYNAFCVISDLVNAKAGTLICDEDRFMAWKSVDGRHVDEGPSQWETLFKGMLEKSRLLDIIRNFIFFEKEEAKTSKILGGYHQYFAVKKAIHSALEASAEDGDGKGGVFWHTQGSGKSFSMVFFSKQINEPLGNPTIIVITDRNDLDDQLFGTFCRASDYLRQTPVHAQSRIHLKELLKDRQAGGLIFTTMQKFEEEINVLSDRRNILVIADEAHRSQYGLKAKVDSKSGKVTFGMAKYIRDALPGATFIGFTGTPVELLDRSTREVFGEYIDIYDMTQSVKDNATVPIYYESRIVNLKLNESILRQIDSAYDEMAANADAYNIDKSKREMSQMEQLLGAKETIAELCRDIVHHYEDRQYLVAGKAMVVAYNRDIALRIYKEILRIRPGWGEKVKVVMTGDNNDPEDWRTYTGDKDHRDKLAVEYKKKNSLFKIAIVVDMWLTGFDVPSLDTMYIYKPMVGHTLMQAIARVNRVYPKKEGGLVVDYVGIARALRLAMKTYTKRDDENYGDNDIGTKALPKFMEKLEVLRDMFYGVDYSEFINSSDLERARLIADGMDFIIYDEEDKKAFITVATALRNAESLCRSLLSHDLRMESAYFEAIRAGVVKIDKPEKLSLKDVNERISTLLQESVQSEGVINIFNEKVEGKSLFDPAYLQAIADMKQKNLVVELLRKLLADAVRAHMRMNVVQSELFSERMANLMLAYRNKQITNAEVIEELIKLAETLSEAQKAGNLLGLTPEEKAFYDALTKPEAIKDFYTNDQLKAMTQELADLMRSNATIDWNKRDSARARMRSMVKRLLKKYHYPPESAPEAIEIVLKQAEKWSEEVVA